MTLRFLYTMELYIDGDTMEECKEKWDDADLSKGEFVTLDYIEDEDYHEISVRDFEHNRF